VVRIRIAAARESAAEALGPGLARLSAQLSEGGFKNPQIDLGFEDALAAGGRRQDGRAPGSDHGRGAERELERSLDNETPRAAAPALAAASCLDRLA
jgi:hypothetical protein